MIVDLTCPTCGRPVPADAPRGLCPACLLQQALGTDPPGAETQPTAPPDAAATLPTGHILGNYELLGELGRGAMGIVYKARDRKLPRDVALKVVRGGEALSPSEMQRFKAEAEIVAHLDHPNIVPVYDVGQHEGQPYFSMKLIDGETLAGWIKRHAPGRKDDQRQAAAIVTTVARAVHHAHQRRLLHRDPKPSNVLVDRANQPHVADFGLAKRLDATGAMTQSGAVVGTPSYMAPEQACGAPHLTTAVDVYGLGAILHEMLTGKPPFRGANTLEILLAVRDREPRPLRQLVPGLSRDLETICLKCLEKDPARRYGSTEALANDLDHWLAGEPIDARRSGPVERLWKWARRRPAVAALAGCVVVLVGVVIGLLVVRVERAETGQAKAVEDAAAAKKLAEQKAREARLIAAHAALQKGLDKIERHEVGPGLLWLVRGLELAPEDAPDLRETIRYLLGGWRNAVPTLRGWLPLKAGPGHRYCFAPDSRTLAEAGRGKDGAGFVQLWDSRTLQPRGKPISLVVGPGRMAFSSDGTRLVVSDGKAVEIVYLQNGEPPFPLLPNKSPSRDCQPNSPSARTASTWSALSGLRNNRRTPVIQGGLRPASGTRPTAKCYTRWVRSIARSRRLRLSPVARPC
jgi:tRNA A-37 threonylcarbamoyl transferase component Bud32